MFKFIRRVILTFILLCLLVVGVVVGIGYKEYKTAIENNPLEEKVELLRLDPHYVEYEDLSQDYINAVVCIEDKRFFSHGGIDYIALARTMYANINAKNILGGGSTITQQLAKNFYFLDNTGITRKIAEVFVAYDLEKMYEKEEIFEMYANIIYFGDNYYGIYDASMGYFKKYPSTLSLAQASLLAGLPQAPSIYALSNHNEATYRRQQEVLKAMLEEKKISTDAFIEAIREDIR